MIRSADERITFLSHKSKKIRMKATVYFYFKNEKIINLNSKTFNSVNNRDYLSNYTAENKDRKMWKYKV